MNQIRAIQALNKKEIENGISPEGSWHVDYRDTAFVNFGGLPYEISEGDVIAIFSQFGEPVWLKLARDKETGKSKGFGWLKYEDQRSTDLAVDNLGGATMGGRLVRVDHSRYEFRENEDPEEGKVDWETTRKREREAAGVADTEEDSDEEEEKTRPMLSEERELARLIREHDEDDPMREFLIEEKKKEVDEAVRRYGKKDRKRKREGRSGHKHGHRHRHRDREHRSYRSGRNDSDEEMRDVDDGEVHKGRRSRRDDSPAERDADREEARRERRRHGSRERSSRRDKDRRDRDRDRSRDRPDRHGDRHDEPRPDRDRRRRGRDDEDEPRRRRRYEEEDERTSTRRHSHSRSPRRR